MMEFEQIVKELIELGKKNGSVSSREILKYYPIESKEYDNKNKLHVAYINLEIEDEEETGSDIIYYVFYDNKVVLVEALTYNGDKKAIANDIKEMVDSFRK
ncbi:MAG: hypothetical protein K2I77_06180 [Anaeroplasmataceae bacterium]|nr:hypothetical protein [Anaeroplasmataceae bacterium]